MSPADNYENSIAIIGVAGRFSGAPDCEVFWENLVNGVESISGLTENELERYVMDYYIVKGDQNYVRARGVIDSMALYGAGFLKLTARDALILDTQQRIWQGCVREALEQVGYIPETFDGVIGLYAGGGFADNYFLPNICRSRGYMSQLSHQRSPHSFFSLLSNRVEFISTGTSHRQNLEAPSLTSQTGCSTSLVAVYHACQSLLTYESDLCLAGGVSVMTLQESGYLAPVGATESPDGHCRPFDAMACEALFRSGVGVVALKRLNDALEASDNILAVIHGIAINNEGSAKIQSASPGSAGQAEVIAMACAGAEAEPESISCGQARGMATSSVTSPVFGRASGGDVGAACQSRRSSCELRRVSRYESFPLSPTQQHLWYLDQLSPNAPVHNLPFAFRFFGRLDKDILGRSLNEMVKRHEVLRTTFPLNQGVPVQCIAPSLSVALSHIDYSIYSESEREARLAECLEREAARSFDLSKGPMVRAGLVSLSTQEHVMFFMTHQIVFDGISFGVFQRELCQIYEMLEKGRPHGLPQLPVQYADYAHWQHASWLVGDTCKQQLAYWKKQLSGELPVLQLPADYPRPAEFSGRGATETLKVPDPLVESLKGLARQEGVTLFMTFLAAFNVLLYRYTGQSDICVGSPFFNRNIRLTDGVIGFFSNTLVLRTACDSGLQFSELLRRVKETCIDASNHQEMPFDRIVTELRLNRDLSMSPLCQVLFVFLGETQREGKMGDISWREDPIVTHVAQADLMCSIGKTDGGMKISFQYATDLFSAETIRRMLNGYLVLLQGVAGDPGAVVERLPMLTDSDREKMRAWNETESDYPRGECVHELFEGQVQRTPNAQAVLFEGATLSYIQLNKQADDIAHCLRNVGVGPGCLVGICVERSLEMLAGLLGILKSGGAYVPLDPEYPGERLAYMMEQADLSVLLTQRSLLSKLPESRAQIVCMDGDIPPCQLKEQEGRWRKPAPGDLAYVIFTSGSTGKPKGVQVPHGTAVNFLSSMAKTPGMGNQDVLLAVTTLSFDIAVLELFLPLAVGARVVIVGRDIVGDGLQLATALQTSGATVMQATPSTWRLLLAAGWRGHERLKVLCGGEPFPADLARELIPRVDAVWNMYGPTETTVWSTCCRLHAAGGPISVGRPIANTQVHILDSQMQKVPLGVAGEIWIGGEGVTRGYLNRPELTAATFVPDPFCRKSGARLYKTGDLGRYAPDGNIGHLGRIDTQVKVRGFRIEPGEIESVLSEHKAVRQAIVTVWEAGPGDMRLVAHILYDEGVSEDWLPLRKHLRMKLPDYMIPQHFIAIDNLPLTPAGKVDRKKIQGAFMPQALPVQDFVAPESDNEKMLAEIWQEELGVSRVGVHDNFFDAGGHSLLAVRVIARVLQETGVQLTPRVLFLNTLGHIVSHHFQNRCPGPRPEGGEGIVSRPRFGRLPLSSTQQRLWYLDQLNPLSPVYNLPYAFRFTGVLDKDALGQSVNEIIKRHESLRTTFAHDKKGPWLVIAPSLTIDFPHLDYSILSRGKSEAKLAEYLEHEAARPFDLSKGPLVRAALVSLSVQEHVMFFMPHHIVFDGLSIAIFLRELFELYEALKKGRPHQLADLTVQYADYAHWQQQRWMKGDAYKRQETFWKGQLGGELPVLQLPLDFPRPAEPSGRGATETLMVPDHLVASLKKLARKESATLFMVFLSAFKTLLHRYSGQNEICVCSPFSNRVYRETEMLIGFFANTLVLRTATVPGVAFVELLKSVRETCLNALSHQEMPFEHLIQALNPQRGLSVTPMYQAMFVFEGEMDLIATMDKVAWHAQEITTHVSRTDVVCSVENTGQGMSISFEYSTDLFRPETVARWVKNYLVLLEGIAAKPESELSMLPLLSHGEREQMARWNVTGTNYPREASIQSLFEARVENNPHASAVTFQDISLSYGELNQRANQLAHHLRRVGVQPGELVGLCYRRSLEMVVGLLGILKAGAAYVPLDPAYPAERLRYMLGDTQIQVLIVEQPFRDRFPDYHGTMVGFDSDAGMLSAQSEYNPAWDVGPESRAYVMYTSGSTGQPKGIEVTHRNVARLVKNTNYVRLDENEVLLQYAPTSFDASTFEIWGALLNGGRVVVCPPGQLSSGDLGRIIQQNNVTTLWLASGLFHHIVEHDLNCLRSVRQILSGGDVLASASVKKVLNEVKGVCVINGYGPTENTTFTCCYPMTEACQVGMSVPIGRPIANTKVYILDGNMNQVPIGVAGELYTSGDGVARGYLNRPQLTNNAFLFDPFSGNSHSRLYKTGDMARYLPDGRIEFLGRLDHQVKVRGHRIELGDIESVLSTHESVRQAVVMVREDRPGDKRLAAYFVAHADLKNHPRQLRDFLQEKFPDYMVPQFFIKLDAIPITANGKTDRGALPAPSRESVEERDTFIAPRTQTERDIAKIWQDVICLDTVSVNDNFFEIGGHSLLAVTLISTLSDRYGVKLPLASLFTAPTVESLSRTIDRSMAESKALNGPLDSTQRGPGRNRNASLNQGDGSEMAMVSRSGHLPLSSTQQRLWYIDQLKPRSPVYNVPFAFRFSGELDENLWCQSLNEIIKRHESFRTTFTSAKGIPAQVIAPSLTIDLPYQDYRMLSVDVGESKLSEYLEKEAATPFELSQGPLVRARLVSLPAQEHVMFFMLHHIIFDGISLTIFQTELFELYDAFKTGRPHRLPELTVQYADYAHWQQERWMKGEAYKQQLAYWKNQLVGEPPVLQLPADFPRPAELSDRGATETLVVPDELLALLNGLARKEGATLFMVLLAAFNTLLHRYSGQEDICIGSPFSGRVHKETEGVIGFFANTLVLRTACDPDMRFCDLVRRVKDICVDALNHQEMPFGPLVQELNPQRGLSVTPLYQVMFVFEGEMALNNTLGMIECRPQQITTHVSRADLTCSIEIMDAGLQIAFEYATDLFTAETIKRLLTGYRVLLEGVVAEPSAVIASLPVQSESEVEKMATWNDTARDYPSHVCLHHLFEMQVEKTPEVPALVFENSTLTYRELSKRTSQLAHYLRKRGVGPETCVGIFMERSMEMVVAIYGVLKAGGAYVPLDPDYPAERVAHMLEDTNVPVVLTQTHLKADLPEHSSTVVCLDGEWGRVAEESTENPVSGASSDNLAYVIYTSGSTGKPKGVMNTHKGICNRLFWMQDEYGLSRSDHVLQKTPYSFDVSVWEFFWPLLFGARLIVAPPGIHKDPASLIQLICDEEITTLHFVPSMLQHFLRDKRVGSCTSLKQVICSGEALSFELQERFFEQLDAELHNLYGPTEAAVDVTYWKCRGGGKRLTVPIGKPVSNTQIHILDRYMRPVPVGVSGELHIGGVQVARGYLNRPELTDEKFVPDPFRHEPGACLYKTGDLARYLSDGNVEYLGRNDFQVKVRGLRIELGEIEAVICSHPNILETVVVAGDDALGNKHVVAYIVVGGGLKLDAGALRGFLNAKLPDYMIPSFFIQMDALPLLANGKVNRKALPDPKSNRLETGSHYAAPGTEVEKAITEIWQALLGIDKIGINDNFFEIGGHSLLAVALISSLSDRYRIKLPLASLFTAPTIASLSRLIDWGMAEANEQNCLLDSAQNVLAGNRNVSLNQRGGAEMAIVSRSGHLPLSSTQQRLWYIDQLKPRSPVYNMAFAFRFSGELDEDLLSQSLNEIIKRHEALRTTFTREQGLPAQVIAPSLSIDLPHQDYSMLSVDAGEAKLSEYLENEAARPFELWEGPLVRFGLVLLPSQEHVLFFMPHHIIFDGISLIIFQKELFELYGAFKNGRPPRLPELTVQYADYAYWQQERWMKGEAYNQQLAYWKKQLAGELPVLQLPADFPRPAELSDRGATESLNVSDKLVASLSGLARREGATLFMVFLAAFKTLLHRYSGQVDICVGSPFSNRIHQETEGLIGFFTNTLVLRTACDPGLCFSELVTRVKETCVGAINHQEMPFENLVQEINPQRGLSVTPLYQAMFVFEGEMGLDTPLGTIAWRPQQITTRVCRTDLVCSIGKSGPGMAVHFEYSTDLFRAETVKRWIKNYKSLLEGIAAKPESQIALLPVVSSSEQEQMALWNLTHAEYPREASIQELFEAEAAKNPHAPAVTFDGLSLSYGEINKRANQMAHHLRREGVQPEAMVGLCYARSFEMIIGILGILKAGAAYVPLDPAYPDERLRYMLEDTQSSVLMVEEGLEHHFPDYKGTVMGFGPEDAMITDQPEHNPAAGAMPDSRAYVMYTSGSTGQPKGIEITHRNVIRLVKNTNYVNLDENEVILQYAPISFDASTFEIWGALLNGGRLVVCPPGQISSRDLGRAIEKNKVTTLWLTAGLFHHIADHDLDCLRCVRQVLSGGDVLAPAAVKKVLNEFTGICVINGYGPTENTTFTSCYPMTEAGRVGISVPIGRPIANTKVYILDEYMNQVPIGVAGELYTSGDGIARGYLNRPELTKKVFLSDPFSKASQARIYKTGDLARYRHDGSIEFLGRIDRQVKIRGYRIELGGIESALSTHEAVRQAVVLAREDRPGDKRLVAYVVANEGFENYARQLRDFLQHKIPDYMVPQYFIQMEAIPITANGKTDRDALPAPSTQTVEDSDTYIAPRTNTESEVMAIWQGVIGLEEISVVDNFFEIGGHSLLAVAMFSKLSQVYGVDFPLSTLFHASTVEALSRMIDRHRSESNTPNCSCESNQEAVAGETGTMAKEAWTHLVSIQPEGNRPPFFCMHAVGGNVLNYFAFVPVLGPDQPLYGLQSQGLDGLSEPYGEIEIMAGKYIEEMRVVQPRGPYYLGGGSMGGLIAVEVANQLKEAGEKIAFLAMFDTFAPSYFDPEGYKPNRFFGKDWVKKIISTHIPNLMGLSLSKQVSYLYSRVINRVVSRIVNRVKLVRCKLYHLGGRPIPHGLRYWYVEYRNMKPAFTYSLTQYEGKLTLFSDSSDSSNESIDMEKGWREFISGEIETVGIPANHFDFVEDPLLGESLSIRLWRAQQEHGQSDGRPHDQGGSKGHGETEKKVKMRSRREGGSS